MFGLAFFILYFTLAQSTVYFPDGTTSSTPSPCTAITGGTGTQTLLFVATYTFTEDSTLNTFSYIPCGPNIASSNQTFVIYDSLKRLQYTQAFQAASGSSGNRVFTNVQFHNPQAVTRGRWYIGTFLSISSFDLACVTFPSSNFQSLYERADALPQNLSQSVKPYNMFTQITVTTSNVDSCSSKDCLSCTASSTCTWCLDTDTCISKSQPGCPDRSNNPNRCGCYAQTSCLACTNLGRNCSWCENPTGDKCVLNSTQPQCESVIVNPKYCDIKRSDKEE
jgi:hypothetical protein